MTDSNSPPGSPGAADADDADQGAPDPAAPASPPQAEAETPAKPKRSWKQRWFRRLLWFLLVLVVLRIAFAIALPYIIDRALRHFDLKCDYESLDISMLGADVELWHFRLMALDADPDEGVYAHTEYCRADVSVLALLRGRLVVRRLECDGVDLFLERDVNGLLPILDHFSGAPDAAPDDAAVEDVAAEAAEDASASDDHDEAVTLKSPLEISALRLQHAQLHFHDASVTPAQTFRVDCHIRLSDFAHDERKTRFALEVTAPGVLPHLVLEGTSRFEEKQVSAEFVARLDALAIGTLSPYLEEAGIDPRARQVSGGFRGSLHVTADPQLRAALEITDVDLLAANAQPVRLDTFEAVLSLDAQSQPTLERVLVAGGHVTVQRHDSGVWSCAGIELSKNTAAATVIEGPRRPPLAPSVATQGGRSPLAALAGLQEFAITDCVLHIADALAGEAPPLGMHIATMTITPDTTSERTKFDLAVDASLPGVAGEVRVAGACEVETVVDLGVMLRESIGVSAAATGSAVDLVVSGELAVEVAELTSAGLRPYLDGSGLELTIDGARAGGRVAVQSVLSGHQLGAGGTVRDVYLESGTDRIGFDLLEVSRVQVDARARSLEVGRVHFTGTHFAARREVDGALTVPGVRYQATPNSAEDAALEQSPAPTAIATRPHPDIPESLPWQVSISEVVLDGAGLAFRDELLGGETFVCSRLGLEMRGVTMGTHYPSRAGQVRARCVVPGVIDRLELQADVTPQGDANWLAGTIRGTGLSTERLLQYLPEGVVAQGWQSANAACAIDLGVRTRDGVHVDAGLRDLDLHERGQGEAPLFRCRSVSIQASATDGAVRVDEVVVDRPELDLRRDSGAVSVLGFDFHTTAPVASATPAATAPQENVAQGSDEALVATPPSSLLDLQLPTLPPLDLTIGVLALQAGELRWDDTTIARSGRVVADAALRGFSTTSETPAEISGRLTSDQFFERATLDGVVAVRPSLQEISLTARMTGINGTQLGAVMPAGVALETDDATFTATLLARLTPHVDGGHSAGLYLDDCSFAPRRVPVSQLGGGPRGVTSPIFVRSVACEVARWDAAAQIYALGEFSIEGLRAAAMRRADGKIHVAGITIGGAEGSGTRGSEPAGATRSPRRAVAAPGVADTSHRRKPRFEIHDVNVGVDEFIWFEDGAEQPLRVVELTLQAPLVDGTRAAWIADLAQDADPGPLQLALSGRLDPIVADVDVRLTVEPFAAEPLLQLTGEFRGIDGPQVVATLPQLASTDPAPLGTGEFHVEAQARWTSSRRGPLDFGIARGVTIDAAIDDVRLTDQQGVVVAGVKNVLVDGVEVDPRKQRIQVSSIEIDTPRGRMLRETDSLQVAGMRLGGAAAPAGELGDAAATAPVDPAATTAPAQTLDPTASQGRAWQILVDQLAVNGIDFELEDRTGADVCRLPLKSLGLGVQNFSTGVEDPKPLRFDLMVESGPGEGTRPWLLELTSTGQVTFGDSVTGRVRTQIGGLDLVSVRDPAAAAGVMVGGGTFDGRVDLRLQDDGDAAIDSEFLFTDLDLQEPDKGPIERYLKLPLSLQPAIFLLRDEAGVVRVPVAVTVGSEGLGMGKLTGVIASTTAQVIGEAIASSPLRLAGTVTGLAGLSGEKADADVGEEIVEFASGDVAFSRSAAETVDRVLETLADDEQLQVTLRHEVGAADLKLIERRVTPSDSERRALLERLRMRRGQQQKARVARVRAVREATLVNAVRAASTARREVQELDVELGQIELAIDRLLDAGDRAPHRVARRVRKSAIELAKQRLATLQQWLQDAGVEPQRVRVIAPRSNDEPEEAQGRARISLRRLATES